MQTASVEQVCQRDVSALQTTSSTLNHSILAASSVNTQSLHPSHAAVQSFSSDKGPQNKQFCDIKQFFAETIRNNMTQHTKPQHSIWVPHSVALGVAEAVSSYRPGTETLSHALTPTVCLVVLFDSCALLIQKLRIILYSIQRKLPATTSFVLDLALPEPDTTKRKRT